MIIINLKFIFFYQLYVKCPRLKGIHTSFCVRFGDFLETNSYKTQKRQTTDYVTLNKLLTFYQEQ